MILFGHEIPIRAFSCSTDGQDPVPLKPYVNLFVRITDSCDRNCPFCIYHSNSGRVFDRVKFDKVLRGLKDIRVKKVAFTGGEPTLFLGELNWAVKLVQARLDTFQVLNTNGFGFSVRRPENLPVSRGPQASHDYLEFLDNVALSCHHWDFSKNETLFGGSGAASHLRYDIPELLRDKKYNKKLHMRCNLVKGYVDSAATIYEYLCRFAHVCSDFGFVSLRRVNDFARDHFIDTVGIDFSGVPQVFPTRLTTRGKCCCRNYVAYNESGQLVHFYIRTDDDVSDSCESLLVYDVDHLKIGFSGETFNVPEDKLEKAITFSSE